MPRIQHGVAIRLESLGPAIESLSMTDAPSTSAVPDCLHLSRFGYLFRDLPKDPKNLLPECAPTVAALVSLGCAMGDPGTTSTFDSKIPSAYTYFAQFVSHDITFEAVTQDVDLNKMPLKPWPVSKILKTIWNSRRPTLDLDSVYEPAFYEGSCYPAPHRNDNADMMRLGPAVSDNSSTWIHDRDLPRWPENHPHPDFQRAAQIGDGRNDENVILSQLHVAFLLAHNAIVKQGNSFEQARKLLRQHYQWIVINDFLNRVADPDIVKVIRSGAIQVYDPPGGDDFFMPLEFTVAAFRFGHSMVRSSYNYNEDHQQADLLFDLFMSNTLARYPGLPTHWIIQWDKFVRVDGANMARRIDTRLVEPLGKLIDMGGKPLKFERRLAVRDLLRAYVLKIPTGQAIARALNCDVLSETEIKKIAGEVSKEQKQVLHYSGFSSRTPLWFYILAEAAHAETGRLGPVGSMLVAAVLIGLVRRSEDSILRGPAWSPTLGQAKGQFDLPDLLRLAGVLT